MRPIEGTVGGVLAESILESVLSEVRRTAPRLCRAWFGELRMVRFTSGTICVAAANRAQHSYLTDHCGAVFSSAAQAVTSRLVGVQFEVAVNRPDDISKREIAEEPLRPTISLDDFVVDSGNRLAHATIKALASGDRSPAVVLLHGPMGSGKSHLLCGLVAALMKSSGSLVPFQTADALTQDVIAAAESHRLREFTASLVDADCWLVDDLEILRGRPQSMDVLFRVLNERIESGRPSVFTTSLSLEELLEFPERIRTRLKSGMVAGIDWPNWETRMVILRRRSELLGLSLPHEVLAEIASVVGDSDVRHLREALERIERLAMARGEPPSAPDVKSWLSELDSVVDLHRVIAVVGRRLGHSNEAILGRGRQRGLSLARRICLHLAYETAAAPLTELATRFGLGKPNDVRVRLKRMGEEIHANARLAGLISELRRGLAQGTRD